MNLNRRHFLGAAGTIAGTFALPSGFAQEGEAFGRTANTKFAVNIEMWWRSLPFLDRIRAAHSLGFPAVEFWNWRGKDLDAISDLTGELGIDVAQFTAWGFVPGMNDPKNHPQLVDAIGDACEVAAKLRCKKATVVGGNDQPGMSQKEMHDHITEGLKLVAPVAKAGNLMLILEPMNIRVDHKGHCLYGSPDAVRICREVDSPWVKINWDLYHMQISEGDLCGRLRDGFDQVGYVQLADHPGRREPGTGEIQYSRVLREVKDLGYDGYVGLECVPEQDERLAAERIARADRW